MGHTTCQSERHDKRIWHKRWRLRERIKLASLTSENFDDHCTTGHKEVSSPWNMAKDGKSYFAEKRQASFAKSIAIKLGKNHQEQTALKKRILSRFMGK